MGGELERWQNNHRQAQGGMTFWPLLATTALYLITAASWWREGNTGLAIAFAGYALGNLGFLYICWFGQP